MAIKPLEAAFDTKAETSSRSKRRALVLGAFAIAVLGTAGSVYAASININNASDIQFAQGLEDVVACDTNADFAIDSALVSGAFEVNTVTLTFANSACNGLDATLYLLDSNGAALNSTVTSQTVADLSATYNFSDENIASSSVTDVAIEITN